ncbi:MAG: type III pantothenate kinase [Phycisphaerae bacterium]|nr:type III pantothenate kinase [Phycisphaerae bacterium]
MNLLAIDIGNTNIRIGLFLENEEKEIISIEGTNNEKIAAELKRLWEQIPVAERSKEKKRDGTIVASSVKPAFAESVSQIIKQTFGEKMLLIGKDIPFPINLSVKGNTKVGTDRITAAAAAYAVVESAVVIADFGTAVTVDLVDDRGVFVGGCIFPGFEMGANALQRDTAQLPKITVHKPDLPWGTDTEEAINCGLYYSAVGAMEDMVRRFAEKIGRWPQTVITGTGARLIKDDCAFVDSYVPNLVIKGIALAYTKYIETRE